MKKDAYLLLFAQWISACGNQIHQLALPILIFQKTGSAGDFALALLAETLPWVLIAPFSAAYLQRFSSKSILIAADILRAGLCIFIALFPWTEFQLLIAMVLLGTCSSVYGAFRIQTVRKLVPRNSITKYLSLSSGGNEIISMVAPALGAALIAAGISSTLFMIFDAFTFLISFAILVSLPRIEVTTKLQTSNQGSNLFSQLMRVRLSRSMKAITGSESLRAIAEGLFIPGILTLMIQVHSFAESEYAWVRTCMAISGVVSSIVFVKLENTWSALRSHTVSTTLIIVGVLALPFIPSFLAALVLGFIIGLGMSFKQLLFDTIVITQSDERYQAETITLVNGAIALAYCIGYAISTKWHQPSHAISLFVAAGCLLATSLWIGPFVEKTAIEKAT